MNDDRRLMKWLIVIVPTVGALLAIYPPQERLKYGIDLAGGSSLLFEIDTSGLDRADQVGLAEQVMGVLKKRVDPNGQLNLIWRPIGNNRLEIQMPRPPKEAMARRKAFEAARKKVEVVNLTRREIESALHAPEDEREAVKAKLIKGVSKRDALLDRVFEAYDNQVAIQELGDLAADDAARAALESMIEDLMDTSIDIGRLTDVLALPNEQERTSELTRMKLIHSSPEYASALDEIIARYDEWAEHKGALEDPSDLKRRIRGAGVLEFRMLAERDLATPTKTKHNDRYLVEPISKYTTQLIKRGPRSTPGDNYRWFEVGNILDFLGAGDSIKTIDDVEQQKANNSIVYEKYAGKWYVLAHAERKFGLLHDGDQKWKLDAAFVGVDGKSGGPAVNFELDPRGGRLFANLTADNIERPMAIMLDNVAQSFATIRGMIRESGQITSPRYTTEKVNETVSSLRAGSLPARLIDTPIMEQTVGPQLGEFNRTKGLSAALYGGIAVAIFMLVYYHFAGVVANIALMMNLLFVLGIMASMQATFTLPGIAGLILTVGMAVDANVLIFERIREERARGSALRKALRLGYERAFSTIIDANVTTLITCVVLGYVGTEEVKGFAMVLGFGIATSMFTSLFVTRLIFTTLIERGMLKNLSMLQLIHRPSIDWLSLRRMFWPVSMVAVSLALVVTIFQATTDREALFDIEFLGGTSVQFEMRQGETLSDEEARQMVASATPGDVSAVSWLRDTAADAIGSAGVAPGTAQLSFDITTSALTGEQIESLMRELLEKKVERGGFHRAAHGLTIDVKPEAEVTIESLRADLERASLRAKEAASRLASARVQTVRSLGAGEDAAPSFEVTTVETNKSLVKTAILAVMGDRLSVERSVAFTLVTDDQMAPDGLWAIEDDAHYLGDVIGEAGVSYDVRDFKGGVALILDQLDPPLSVESFERRIREIRLQPEFSQFDTRPYQAIGMNEADSGAGEPTYTKIAYVVVDPNTIFSDDPQVWETSVAQSELTQVTEALATEKSLRKVVQFAPQVAHQTQNQATIAIVMALAAIVAYIWIRFGQMQFGLAAIVALVHDVTLTLGLVAASHYVYNNTLGQVLGLMDFKIDLPMIAAFLTIIGYSLNDTIVVFDRIRENRGKLKKLTPTIINNSINQCLSRTVLTSFTTFLAVGIMYVFGGPGIHGFSFALLIGVVVGTYSSIGIATPLLYRPKVLHMVVYVLIAAFVFIGFAAVTSDVGAQSTWLAGAAVVIGCVLVWAISKEMRSSRTSVMAA
jgi:SecD/SecF fusion protein